MTTKRNGTFYCDTVVLYMVLILCGGETRGIGFKQKKKQLKKKIFSVG